MNLKIEVLSTPAKTQKLGSILFVHGICHGAWGWKRYQDYFSDNGYDAHALSLRGHGNSEGYERINDWGLDDYVDDVLGVISTLNERPVVVGHSMGGAVLQKLIARDQSKIKAGIFLAPSTATGSNLKWKLRTIFKSPLKSLAFMSFLRGRKISAAQVKKSIFMNDRISLEDAETIKDKFCVESKKVIKELANPYVVDSSDIKIPVAVIGSRDDLLFNATDLTETARHLGAELIVLDGLCHNLQVDVEWEKVPMRY